MGTKNIASRLIASIEKSGLSETAAKVWRKLSGNRYSVPDKLSMVVFEITTYCNLECSGCVRTVKTDEGTWTNKHIGVVDYRKVIGGLPPAKLFIPQGVGEPTMHPQILEIIAIAKESGKFDRIEINSNGLARSIDFYAELFDGGLDDLTISVDTLDGTLIEKLRAKTDIPRLETRLQEFSERFPNRVGIRVTVSKGNISELPALFRRLDTLGRFKVFLQPFFDMGFEAGVLDLREAESLSDKVPGWEKEFPNLKIKPEPFERSKEICQSPWTSPAFTVNGDVKPCCIVLHEEVNFGNALQAPFQDIWRSEDVERFRRSFVEKSPDCCRRCPYYAERV